MNIIFIKHRNNDAEYCYEVPELLSPYIKKNMLVIVDNARGISI